MVLVAIPHQGYVHVELSKILNSFGSRDDVELYYSSDRPVDVNRNKIVNYFLDETEHDNLVMIDSDIIPPENILDILEYDHDVIAPIMFSTKDGVPYPVATDYGADGNYRMYAGELEEVTKVEGVGTGCVAISREVLEALEPPYFEFTKDEDGTLNTGEDFNFCVAVNKAGFDVEIAKDYVCGHSTEVNLEDMMRVMSLALEADKSNINIQEVGSRESREE